MAKNSIRDYDATSGNNTDVQSVDISEGCAASGINNALREIMTDLKNVSTGAVALETPAADQLNVDNIRIDGNTISSTDTNGNVTIDPNGTGDTVMTGSGGQVTVDENGHITSKQSLDVATAGGRIIGASNRGTVGQIGIEQSTTSADGGHIQFSTCASGSTNPTERMRIDSSGNVGIGGAPNDTLHVYGDIVIENTTNTPYIDFVESGDNTDSKARILMNQESGTSADLEFHTESGGTLTKRVVFDHDGHVQIQCNASTGDLLWKEGTTDVWAIKTNGANSHLAFYDDYNNAERMRIANSGEVIIGAITQGASSCLRLDGNGTVMVVRVQNASDGTLRNGILFRNASDSTVGVIQVNSSSTNYATSSDYRLKENVADMTGAITRVKALAPKRFNFIVDPETTVDGFLAHEAQTVVPEAITGTKDAMMDEDYVVNAATGDIYTPAAPATYDEDGEELTAATDEVIHSSDAEKPEELADGQQWRETTAAVMGTRSVPDYQGIDQSKLVPLLTGALQEAIAKIETLETQRADLETRLTALENA